MVPLGTTLDGCIDLFYFFFELLLEYLEAFSSLSCLG